MTCAATVEVLFERAIAAEHAAEALYRGLEAKFAAHEDVVAFWHSYAEDEVGHAKWLERFRDGLTPEELDAPADCIMLDNARRAMEASVDTLLAEVHDLEDAYELVNELENAETNAVFEFMLANFSKDEDAKTFLRSQLKDHIGKLMIEFPSQFASAAIRRQIKALP